MLQRLAIFIYFFAAPCIIQAAMGFESCKAIESNDERLACYDRESGRDTSVRKSLDATSAHSVAEDQPKAITDSKASWLSQKWELTPETKRGLFNFQSHYPNYFLLARYNSSPNEAPFRQLDDSPLQETVKRVEMKYQLSFKLKVLENAFDRADLWFAYTQQSYWQAYNRPASSPFRETDYKPELMLVFPTDFQLLGLNGKFINIGLLHHSNGRGSSLSRSWNRVYAQVGLERDNFILLVRPWYRVRHKSSHDDNPDISQYMGYGDLIASYKWKDNEISAILRHNFRTGKGGTELNWAFPLAGNIMGFIQFFSGYGESLIDYNHHQNTIGAGFLVNY